MMPDQPGDRRGYRTIDTPKRVRARVGAKYVADSTSAKMLVYSFYPHTYLVPLAHVAAGTLGAVGTPEDHEALGVMVRHDVVVGDRTLPGAAWVFGNEAPGDLAGHVALDWDAMDAWYEEDDEVYGHPHDPFKRIDILSTSRPLRVEVDGHLLAESVRSMLLFETHLPTRYYLPQPDVAFESLRDSASTTTCAYKGHARYYDVVVPGATHRNLAWRYDTPFPEAQRVAGMVCFFNERVDLIFDGKALERPNTPWVKPIS